MFTPDRTRPSRRTLLKASAASAALAAGAALLQPSAMARQAGDGDLEANKALVRRVYVAFSGGDPADLDTVIAPDFAHHPLLPDENPGREGFKGVVKVFRTVFPDFDVTLEDVVAEGDKVAIRGIARGTQRGDLLGIAPTGKPVAFAVADVYRIEDGMIAEGWHLEDYLSIFLQIGAFPPAPTDATPTA